MRGLVPLPMYVLVTTPTVAGRQKGRCRDEATAFGDRLTWCEWAAAERQMVCCLGRARLCLLLLTTCRNRKADGSREQNRHQE